MKATIKTFESGVGDCIFFILKNEESGSSFHIMIDCNTLSNQIVDFISNDLEKRLNVLIVTHADSDHINGLTQLFKRQDMQELCVSNIFFNCFQPRSQQLTPLPDDIKKRLDNIHSLLPPVIDENNQKCSGLNASSFICQLKKRPELSEVWRQEPILAGTEIELGEGWGKLLFLSPTQDEMDEWFKTLKIEFARRTGKSPLAEEFENQDMYYELMARLYDTRMKNWREKKSASCLVSEASISRYAKFDVDENNVTPANKTSLAFIWECNGKKVLFLGDSISSTIVTGLNTISNEEMYFEAIKLSHHGSKHNTSVALINKINTCHYFLTGGKKDEGPSLEAISKLIMKDVCRPEGKHILHYNHIIKDELLDSLLKDDAQEILGRHLFYLTSDNEYTFEY